MTADDFPVGAFAENLAALRREAAFGTADGEPVDAAIDRFTRALAPTTDAVRFALEDAIHDAVFWRAGDQAQKETR